MSPLTMFLLAILSPFLLAISLLVPAYAGFLSAAYIIYYKADKLHPLADKLFDVFYIIDVYVKLFKQWSNHIVEVSFFAYTLPLLLLPAIGIVLSLGLTSKLSRWLQDVFQLGTSS